MIKRENLKKGDIVMVVPNNHYTRDTSTSKAVITAIGFKYITVATIFNNGSLGRENKFNNDDRMCLKDYSSQKLFLGTEEEYEAFLKEAAMAKEIYNEIEHLITPGLGYEKLSKIKSIINGD